VAVSIDVTGPLDPNRLRRAVDVLARRHLLLRCAAILDDADELWLEDTHAGPALDVLVAADPAAAAVAKADLARSALRLTDRPAWRATLLTDQGSRHAVVLRFHHAIIDGESLADVLAELRRCYQSGPEDDRSPAPPPPDFRIFATLMRDFRANPPATLVTYWRKKFAGMAATGAALAGVPEPAQRGGLSEQARLRIDARCRAALLTAARARGVTLFTLLLAAVADSLLTVSGAPETALSVAVSHRARAPAVGTVGMFSDLVVLRIRGGCANFGDFVDHVFGELFDSMDHALPFAAVRRILQMSAIGVDPGALNYFNVAITPSDSAVHRVVDSSWRTRALPVTATGQQLGVVFVEEPDSLRLVITHPAGSAWPRFAADVAAGVFDVLTAVGERGEV
jgi:hypothetical protein